MGNFRHKKHIFFFDKSDIIKNFNQLIAKLLDIERHQELFVTRCEMNQLLCFSHELWLQTAKCVCVSFIFILCYFKIIKTTFYIK